MTAVDPIHVLHVTPWLLPRGGGVAWYIHRLTEHLQALGVRTSFASLTDPNDESLPPHVAAARGHAVRPRALGYSPALRRAMAALPADIQLVHSHGLRLWPQVAARRFATRRRLPLVVSPHGQLDPWVLEAGRARKLLYDTLVERRNLRAAFAFHATADQEARHIRAAGFTQPIVVAPIGLDAGPYLAPGDEGAVVAQWPELRGKKRLLYLTTIYPKKGLPDLARAWARLHRDFADWHLVIGGRATCADPEVARGILAEAGAAERATFVGVVSERMKRHLLACSDLYVLPTRGENFGISIAESLASGTPVVVSNTTPWREIQRRQCGWWIERGVESLCQTLAKAMALTTDERRAMGQRGRELVLEEYQWPRLAAMMRAFYDWVLRGGEKPAFVVGAGQAAPTG